MADVVYHLNAQDELVFVNQAWSDFASANDGEAVQPMLVLRRSLWEFISDSSTRHIYRVLFERVRLREETVRVRFRCDSPAERRLLDLEMTPRPGAGIHCQVHQVGVSSREPVILLDPKQPRGKEFLRVCGWCKRVALRDDLWLDAEDAVTELRLFVDQLPPDLTHGICPDCRRVLEHKVGKVGKVGVVGKV